MTRPRPHEGSPAGVPARNRAPQAPQAAVHHALMGPPYFPAGYWPARKLYLSSCGSRPISVSGTEHMRLPHERLQRRRKLSVVAAAYYGWPDGGWAVREQGVLAHLPEEELQELDAVVSIGGVVQDCSAPNHPRPRDLHERLRPRNARLYHHRAPVEIVLLRVPRSISSRRFTYRKLGSVLALTRAPCS